ncbi:hypothetical protein GL270_09350 [Aeromonas veronii]|uniref:hypothetical protein n=1 Tax=Aeromonas veronii TaxID=654 RepID=UPI001C5AAF44|nr:hypothetical protein [Aeromonas veronii]MBW3781451.1 hypothetical protein [Aeromonas veronii]
MRKFFVILLPIFSVIYMSWPYINGLGCDFNFSLTSEHIEEVGKCKAGLFTTYAYNKETGVSKYIRYLYGKDNDYIYLFKIDTGEREVIFKEKLTYEVDYSHAMKFYDGNGLYIAKYKCVSSEMCHLMFSDDIENIYKLGFKGKTGFYN